METTTEVDRKELLAALTPLKTIVRKHTGIYIHALQCVRISYRNNALEIVATDLGSTIVTTIPSAGAGAQTCLVGYAALVKAVRAHKHGRITLTMSDDRILISSPTATTTLECANWAICLQWPNIPEIEHSPTPDAIIDSAALTTALAQTLPSAGTDSARPTLNCIKVTYAGGLTIQATDGYRAAISIISDHNLAIHSHPIPPTVIPLQIAQAIKAAIITQGETTFRCAAEEDSSYRYLIVRIRDNNARITTDIQTEIPSDPNFPNLQPIWDQPRSSTGTFDRQAMLTALKQILGGSKAKDLILRLQPDTGTHNLTLTIEHAGTTATATIPYEGELVKYETSIGFNAQYFLAGIEAVCSEIIVIESETSMKPIVMKGADTPTEYLLMPIRIDQ